MSCLSRRTGPLMWDSEFNYLTSRGPQYPVGLVKTYAQNGRSEDKVQLRRCFVQSNYSGSWTEPVCVLHRICGHETEDDKKIIDSARLFNSSVIISEWNTHKKSSFPFNACGNRSFLDDDCCNISLTELST